MMILLSAVTVLTHLILPILFLYWVAFNKGENKLYRISVVLFVGSFLILMWFGGVGWHWFGNWWPVSFLTLFAPAFVLILRKSNGLPWLSEKKFFPWAHSLTVIALAMVFATGLPELFSSRNYEETPLNLMFPLMFPLRLKGAGTYHIVHGGSSEFMNHHFKVKAQKYALDITKVNQWGIRADGLLPSRFNAYEIFGEKIYSPCSGRVLAVQNRLPDNVPPQMDPKNLLGNHVILSCNDHSVLLAHLKRGRTIVKKGENVQEGQLISEVGNSGNTSEPHLHIHAVKGSHSSKKEIAGTATGVPILFDQKYLIRNDRITYTDKNERLSAATFLEDFSALKSHISKSYANLEYLIKHYEINPYELNLNTINGINEAKNESQRLDAVLSFIKMFRDGHFKLSKSKNEKSIHKEKRKIKISSTTDPKQACESLGVSWKRSFDFIFATTRADIASQGKGEFPFLVIAKDNLRIGFIRIADFREAVYPKTCTTAWQEYRKKFIGKCDKKCREDFQYSGVLII